MATSIRKIAKRPGHRTRRQSHAHNIRKLLKCVDPDLSISANGLNIMDSFVEDLLGRIAKEASELVQYAGRSTMNPDDIISAAKLVITTPQLRKVAIQMAEKTVQYATKRRNSTE